MAEKLPEGFDWRQITPEDSPKTPMDIMADAEHQRLARADVEAGAPAYGFRSQIYDFSDGTEVATGQFFDLLEVAAEKPVALVFGSYT